MCVCVCVCVCDRERGYTNQNILVRKRNLKRTYSSGG